jgi:SAM-dependent methyltransferase
MNVFRKIQIGAFRALLQTLGRTSDGISIALKHGLISGRNLDYIYRNQPAGRLFIGKYFDRVYLSHRGWAVVRTRKENLELLLDEAISTQRRLSQKPVILDIASGPAGYLVELLSKKDMNDVTAICRDLDDQGLEMGRGKAVQAGLTNIKYTKGDALDKGDLLKVEPRCNIIVSSGFYDWIEDDNIVFKSMSIVSDLLGPGGCFVFTNQCGHFDLELANAAFTDFNHKTLRMVIRPDSTVEQWIHEIGFKFIRKLTDQYANYSVFLVQKT